MPSAAVVALSGELDLATAPVLQQVLAQLCRDGYQEIVLDLSGLEFLSAAGLAVFHHADDHLRAAGGRLILHRPGRLVRRVLAITALDTVLTIRPATAHSLDRAGTNGIAAVYATNGHGRGEPASQPSADHLGAGMIGNDTVSTKYATGQPTSGEVADTAPVLAAVWCCSVGTAWTLELHQLRRDTSPPTLVDWISSGVPISQPRPPESVARELLTQRGLHLFGDSSAGPYTGSRRGIGYVARNAELITLAHLVRDIVTETGLHPVILAAQWVVAGFSADAAARWIRQGVHSPQAAQHQTAPSEPTVAPPTQSATAPSPDLSRIGHRLR
jgi:anti-sigma B factor antagonist